MLAADADLLVLLVEGRAQASATVALRLGGTKSILLALVQAVELRVVQKRADLEWQAAAPRALARIREAFMVMVMWIEEQ
jgi:hypothetical protein